MKKLGDKQFGPFKVIQKVGHSSYKLAIPKTWKSIHPVFNEVLLSRYHEPEFPIQPKNTNPPPEIVAGKEPEYEVERVVDLRATRGGKILYKVKWKGYGDGDNSWEPAANLAHSPELIAQFHAQNPAAPRRLAASLFALLPWTPLVNHTIAGTPATPWEQGKTHPSGPSRTMGIRRGVMSRT